MKLPKKMIPAAMLISGLFLAALTAVSHFSCAPTTGDSKQFFMGARPNISVSPPPSGMGGFNTESYNYIEENGFWQVSRQPLSTFGVDVDTASYSNVRRFLSEGRMPPPDAVRVEEMINYFNYDYTPPPPGKPFGVQAETADCPWNPDHRLLVVGIKGREFPATERPPANLVFLLDVSGSMVDPAKLPLLKRAMRMLVQNLTEKDRVAIVVYAGASGLVLPSTRCTPAGKTRIGAALEELDAGGSTHGSAGIELAYETARENFLENGVNRVILATDGDFNVGVTSQGDLVRLIEAKAKSGVFLSVLGFGAGNLKDSTMEMLADRGNGNYGYIDGITEARKVLVEEIGGSLVTIAKDVKIQVEFNPALIQAYRLIGYENRLLRDRDFNDDAKDAGEIGAGHTVTAIYELVPTGRPFDGGDVDALKYQAPRRPAGQAANGEILTVKIRYKAPQGHTSKLLAFPVRDQGLSLAQVGPDFRFAAAVAGFGMLLRDSKHKGALTWEQVIELASSGRGSDRNGYRAEFINLVKNARALSD